MLQRGILVSLCLLQCDLGLSLRTLPTQSPLALHMTTANPARRCGRGQVLHTASIEAGVVDKTSEVTARKNKLVVRFGDKWVDLTGWRNAHPAGPQWIDTFNGLDATEVMRAFHSDRAMTMLARLPSAKLRDIPLGVAPPTELTLAFRGLRGRLEAAGWFKRNMAVEAAQVLSWLACLALGLKLAGGGWAVQAAAGTTAAAAASASSGVTAAAAATAGGGGAVAKAVLGFLARWAPTGAAAKLLAIFPLAIANTYAGWLAHDFVHGTDVFSARLRHFGGVAAGLGTTMWSDKHNMHHAKTNEVGVDEDLPGGPVLFIWPPSPENDRPWRKFQHLYLPFAYSLLFVVWRIDSVKVAWKRRLWPELAALGLHYSLVCALKVPLAVCAGAVLLSGFMTATIVTVSHQTEDLLTEHQDDWVRRQFLTTRDVDTSNPFSEWLWGGMQYQLLHHLFPDMPRYKYPALRPMLEAFASSHNIEFRRMGEWKLIRRNLEVYRQVAKAPADPNALASTGGISI
mmetsp:Transcript_1434/g.2414  ORF Transcript_1434/g.2414 Transcript_1434/m.2414 type:complete len:513 (+) Transcript_1434:36-1574(+)